MGNKLAEANRLAQAKQAELQEEGKALDLETGEVADIDVSIPKAPEPATAKAPNWPIPGLRNRPNRTEAPDPEATTYGIRIVRKVPAEQYGHGEIEVTATVAVNSLEQLQRRIWGLQRVVNERLYLTPPWMPRPLHDAHAGRADGLFTQGGHSEPEQRK